MKQLHPTSFSVHLHALPFFDFRRGSRASLAVLHDDVLSTPCIVVFFSFSIFSSPKFAQFIETVVYGTGVRGYATRWVTTTKNTSES